MDESCPTIANNAITGNRAHDGGGLYMRWSSPPITNNTIAGNASTGEGGGLYMGGSSRITNNIIAFNSSGVHRSGGTPTRWYNCVYANDDYHYSGIPDPTGFDGNICADPAFVLAPDPGADGEWGTEDDELGDVQLLPGSPCIDAGYNGAVPEDIPDLDGDGNTTEPLPFDLLGESRFLDDPATVDTGSGTPPIVDMGAYELFPDCDGDGVYDQLETDTDGDGAIDDCDDDDDNDGVVDVADADPTDPNSCEDTDIDGCDDCAIGTDDYGPLPDNDPANDGLDTDADGVCDAGDGCPDDPSKREPGICGCGVSDNEDADDDAVPDCVDQCPGENDLIDLNENGLPDCAEPDFIPTVSGWGVVVLALLLLAGAKVYYGRRHHISA